MGMKTEAMFVLNEQKKKVGLFREEGLTGDWKVDPDPKITNAIYVQYTALTNKKVGSKIKVTIEEIDC